MAPLRTLLSACPLFCILLLPACTQESLPSPVRSATTIAGTAPTGTPLPPARPATATPPVAAPHPSATPTPFAPPDLRHLDAAFQEILAPFTADPGTLAGYFVVDLERGQTIAHNETVAISGMSLVKIPILVEAYRVLDAAPSPAQTILITETATLSGNYTANLLLELIAGRPDPFAGAAALTTSLRRFGLYDTFIAVPYDREPRSDYLPTYATLANQGDVTTNPGGSMQTTTRDLGRLLTWIYRCTQGAGPLLAGESGALTVADCREILEVMAQNDIDAFIEAGVPAEVPVAHKHGWVGETHGDAGVILLDQHPYVLVVALHRPGWLEWEESTALIERLSRAAYDHFAGPGAYPAARLATPLPPLPTATATPDLSLARVAGTGGAGLTLRAAPEGQELLILPEGMRLYLLPGEPVEAGGVNWRRVAAPDGLEGWVGAHFLNLQRPGE